MLALIIGIAALLLVQDRGDALGLPVVEQPLHVAHRIVSAFDEHRGIADRLLLLVDRADLLVHHLRADLHVADRVVAVGLADRFPRPRRMRHQLRIAG